MSKFYICKKCKSVNKKPRCPKCDKVIYEELSNNQKRKFDRERDRKLKEFLKKVKINEIVSIEQPKEKTFTETIEGMGNVNSE